MSDTLAPVACGELVKRLDDAMAEAALGRMAFSGEVMTVDIHVSFTAPATGRLAATARVTGGGRSVCFCEAEIADAEGRLVAKAMGTYRYREAPCSSTSPTCG